MDEPGFAKRWRLLSGQENWKNLLDPLDNDLRRYIIHFGEMAQVTSDAFNSEKASRYAGDCRYSMRNLFTRVGLTKASPLKYMPTKYFYATSQIPVPLTFLLKSFSREAWSRESNWMGYVAVATDEAKTLLGRRDIVVAWRGTIQSYEWINDFNFPLELASTIFGDFPSMEICSAWLSLYTSNDPRSHYNKASAREQVLEEVQRLVEQYKDEDISITVTGHSLGAALAILNAADIVANRVNKINHDLTNSCPVTAFAFGSPCVGNQKLQEALLALQESELHILRVRNAPDLVPYYPTFGYTEVGEELLINTLKSNYLKNPGDQRIWHGLEVYMHGVAGTQGKDGGFELEVKRDIALVNKKLDALLDEYLVPSSWWAVGNKGMVQGDDGFWRLQDHEEELDDES